MATTETQIFVLLHKNTVAYKFPIHMFATSVAWQLGDLNFCCAVSLTRFAAVVSVVVPLSISDLTMRINHSMRYRAEE